MKTTLAFRNVQYDAKGLLFPHLPGSLPLLVLKHPSPGVEKHARPKHERRYRCHSCSHCDGRVEFWSKGV